MNRNNGFNAQKPSPGFVYFNNSPAGPKPKTNPADTSDFLAFNDDNGDQSPPVPKQSKYQSRHNKSFSPQLNKFSPGYASSPIQYRHGNNSPRGQGGYRNNRQQFNHSNSQYNQSGNGNRSGSQYSRNSSNCDTSCTDSSFVNSSHNESWNNSGSFNQRKGKKRNSNGETVKDISNYIHPSFFEDPWAILMKVVEDKWKEQEQEEASAANGDVDEEKDEKGTSSPEQDA